MIGTAFLLKDIKAEMQKAVADLYLRAPARPGQAKTAAGKEKFRVPGVYYSGLPARKSPVPVAERVSDPHKPAEDDEFGEFVPFILIKRIDQDFTGEKTRESMTNIAIVFAVFAPEDDPEAGEDDLSNISDRIVHALCLKPFWADNHWKHEMPINVVQGTGRAGSVYLAGLQNKGPYYVGAATTQFKASIPGQIIPPGIIDTKEPEYPDYLGRNPHG